MGAERRCGCEHSHFFIRPFRPSAPASKGFTMWSLEFRVSKLFHKVPVGLVYDLDFAVGA